MAVPLFVTADVPIDTINEVLKLGAMDQSGCIFSLVTSPDQDWVDKESTPPVEDFKTGFSSWSIESLGEYVQARHKEHTTQKTAFYVPITITVLDERSIKDRTIVLGSFTSERREIPENPDYAPPPAWLSVRLRFEDIRMCVPSATWKSFMFFGEESIELVDDNDVYINP